ncbi:MAG TPA: DUF6231 family protein [Gammaproteobacteria bacterium]|nr:DUF6231 family protein [Gammaproteobacteria bacterium]
MDALVQELLSLAAQYHPATLLTVGAEARRLMQEYAPPEECRQTHMDGEQALRELTLSDRFDFALVAGALERLPDERAVVLLSRLRDVHTQRFAVLYPRPGDAPAEHPWQPNDFLAMGLFRYEDYALKSGTWTLYTFDIATYKRTPDWLSPRNWAHPELWDKYRW